MNARVRTPELDEKVRAMRMYMTSRAVTQETGLSPSSIGIITKGMKGLFNGGPRRRNKELEAVQQSFLCGMDMESLYD